MQELKSKTKMNTKGFKTALKTVPFKLTPGTSTATSLSDIVTVVTNISANTLTLGFIPPHGKELAAGASVTVKGDLQAALTNGGRPNQRKLTALQNAIDTKLIKIYVNYREIVYCAVGNTAVIAVGDLVWLNTNTVLSASAFTWDTNLATTQAAFTNKFLGVALDSHANGGGAVTNFRVDMSPNSIYEYAATSATHEIGDTVGPAKNPSSNLLLNQTLVGAVAASSVGRVVRRDAGATATVDVRFQSAYWGNNAQGAQ